MKFRAWLENWEDSTITHIHDPNATQDYVPSGTSNFTGDTTVKTPKYEVPDESTLSQIAHVLEPLAFDSIETGFSGTPAYAAPEQFFSKSTRQADFYQTFLKDVGQLFPELEGNTKEMLDNWLLFRQEVLRRLGKRQYMDAGQKRQPVHYALPLMALQKATPAFEEVKRLLNVDPDPKLANIKKLFFQLYVTHAQLAKRIEGPLTHMLQASRNDPASYGGEPQQQPQRRQRPPAA